MLNLKYFVSSSNREKLAKQKFPEERLRYGFDHTINVHNDASGQPAQEYNYAGTCHVLLNLVPLFLLLHGYVMRKSFLTCIPLIVYTENWDNM